MQYGVYQASLGYCNAVLQNRVKVLTYPFLSDTEMLV